MQQLAQSDWNGLEKSNCNALFLVMEDDGNGVTVCKQGQGWFVFDMRKLLKLKGQEMHEWF